MNFETLQTETEKLKQELTHLQNYAKNLEEILNQIKSAKAFKLWQKFGKIRDKILGRKK